MHYVTNFHHSQIGFWTWSHGQCVNRFTFALSFFPLEGHWQDVKYNYYSKWAAKLGDACMTYRIHISRKGWKILWQGWLARLELLTPFGIYRDCQIHSMQPYSSLSLHFLGRICKNCLFRFLSFRLVLPACYIDLFWFHLAPSEPIYCCFVHWAVEFSCPQSA